MKETLLYGCKVGEPDYMAEVLYVCKGWVNTDELMTTGQKWATTHGYDRLRISVVDLAIAPNFAGTVTI